MRAHVCGWPMLNDGDEPGRVIIRISAQCAAMPGGGRVLYEGYILIARINSRGYQPLALPATSRTIELPAERERESV